MSKLASQASQQEDGDGLKYTGGCLCGAVRYATGAEPVFSGNCHCKDCQRSSGGPFTPAMMFPAGVIALTGRPRFFRSKADSGRSIERGFCPDCGSQLFIRMELLPGVLGIRAGTLDDPARFEPIVDFHVSSAPPWDHMDPTLPKRQRSPQD